MTTETEHSIVSKLIRYNKAYREGRPLVSDSEYDSLVDLLKSINPKHQFLQKVEEEYFKNRKKIKHHRPMLSIDKAYTEKDLSIYIRRVLKAIKILKLEDEGSYVNILVSPKLDGVAGFYDFSKLTSRGDGLEGFDITDIFDKGVVNGAKENWYATCYGEIVISKSYFDNNLSSDFSHPRNLISGLLVSNDINPLTQKALDDKAIQFVPYGELPYLVIPIKDFSTDIINNFDNIKKQLKVDYPTDGLVCQVSNPEIIRYLGHNKRSYNYMIAIKQKGDTKLSVVEKIVWEVGRTGNVTPVVFIKPIKLSGSIIKKVSGYNCGYIEKNKIGEGCIVEIIRSGEVIPKIVSTIEPSDKVYVPDICPECKSKLVRVNNMLKCENVSCRQKVIKSILQEIKDRKIKLFGKKTVEKIVDSGYDSIEEVLEMTTVDFIHCGFGEVLSHNLFNSIEGN